MQSEYISPGESEVQPGTEHCDKCHADRQSQTKGTGQRLNASGVQPHLLLLLLLMSLLLLFLPLLLL